MNINKFQLPPDLEWHPTQLLKSTLLDWKLPSRHLSGMDLSQTDIHSGAYVQDEEWRHKTKKREWLWSGTMLVPRINTKKEESGYWIHVPLNLEVRFVHQDRYEKEDPTLMALPLVDHHGMPTLVLIDEKGWVVPWVEFRKHSDGRIMFLTEKLDGFAFGEPYNVRAIQFLEGRCHQPWPHQQVYRRRLARLVHKLN